MPILREAKIDYLYKENFVKKLLKYFKGYTLQCILGPLFKLLEASFELLIPLVVASIIDVGIKNGDKPYIIKMCIIMAALGLIGLICSVTAQYFAARAAVGFTKKLRHALFDKIQSFSYAKLDKLGTATVITRMTSDMNQVQTGVNLTLRLLLRSPFVVLGAMVMAFTIDVKSALIFAAAIPVLSIIVFGIMLISIPLYKKVQSRLDEVTQTTRENLTGARVIRAFALEDREKATFENKNDGLTAVQRFVGRVSALMNPMTYAIINAATVWLIYTGALRVNSGVLSSGEVVALYNYMSQILIELIKFASLIINITKSVACARRIGDILEISGSEHTGSMPMKKGGDIEFKNVSLRYDEAGDNTLTNISFKVKSGQTVGIIGGTGSGKSSLTNLIPAFYRASSGEILINGQNINDIDTDSLRKNVAVVPQRAVLFSGTIRDNMRWGNAKATDEEIYKALETAQATDIIKSKENGLDSIIEQGGRNLSGGQRQRLTIARALTKNADILILDDSSSALDFATDAKLRAALKSIDNKPTVFIVSQRTSSIKHADIIIVLDDGYAVGIGTHSQLLESCDVYREIYDSQYKKESSNA